jgi:hypothetical protein
MRRIILICVITVLLLNPDAQHFMIVEILVGSV